MSMKVLTIGVGLAGSRFTESLSNKLTTLEEKNTPIYVNICSEELNIFNTTTSSEKVRVGDITGGAGKSRDMAINVFTEKFDYYNFIGKIKKRVIEEDIDIITVSFSTSGGTGSGISPLLIKMLQQFIENEQISDKNVIVIGIALLPSFNEGIGVFRNTLLTLNDINKSIKTGARYILVKNNATEGINFTEKCLYVNENASKLIKEYITGSKEISKNGVLDISDRKMGLEFPGLHSISRLKDCDIVKSPFITPGSSLTKMMLCEIPDENSDMFEAVVSSGRSLDFKFGYTSSEQGLVAHHGFNNLTKETVSYRKRFDDLKALDTEGDIDTGANSLESLKADVLHYHIKKDNSNNCKTEKISKEDRNITLKEIISEFKDFSI